MIRQWMIWPMANKTTGDPTGQRVNRARTARRLNNRLELARREIMTQFRQIPKSRRTVTKIRNNQVQTVYDYDLTPEQLEIFNNRVRLALDEQLLQTTGDAMPMRWWYTPEVEEPVRQGTLEEINEFNRLIILAIGAGLVGAGGIQPQRIAPEVVLTSQKYLSELRNVYMENFQVIKSLSDNTAAQVIRQINSGMRAGSTPTQIAKNINTRFNVAQSNAERIARTEVNRAYNDARMRASKQASEITGLKSFVRHISALLPNRTRKHHAARHYKVYTREQQDAWWDEDANRINCLCSTRTVLIDNSGNYIEA